MSASPAAPSATLHRFDSIDRFRTAVNDSFVPLRVESARPGLRAYIRGCASDGIHLTEVGATAHRVERTDDLIARSDKDMAERPHVYVFGAGHVGDALTMALSLAPLRVVLVDTREEELTACTVPRIETCLTAMPEAVVRAAPEGSSFVILTHDHALDFLIAAEALKRADAAYVGMIGSKTKRATFRNWLTREIGRADLFDRLVCPIGATALKDKRPPVIATLAAAEIMTAALMWRAQTQEAVRGRG